MVGGEIIKKKDMESVYLAQAGLNALKNDVIGVFKHNLGVFELVLAVHEESSTMITVHITPFGAVQHNYGMSSDRGQLYLFPEGMNMNDMLDKPFDWAIFIDQFSQ